MNSLIIKIKDFDHVRVCVFRNGNDWILKTGAEVKADWFGKRNLCTKYHLLQCVVYFANGIRIEASLNSEAKEKAWVFERQLIAENFNKQLFN